MPAPTPQDAQLAQALEALAYAPRIALLRQLRTPHTLREIRLETSHQDDDARVMSRQAVKQHLDKLADVGVVLVREGERDYGPAIEYVLNHQVLFALGEDLRGLARLRPASEPATDTARREPPAPKPHPSSAHLVLVHGVEEGRIFPLDPSRGGRWLIGRRRDASVPLDFDPFISGENSAIEARGERYVLMDLPESRNGTMLNFDLIPRGVPHPLVPGDVIGVGRSLLVFRR